METAARTQPFNAAQRFVLQTFAHVKTEKDRDELTSLYLDFIQKKLDAETEKWWKENEMTTEKFDKMFENAHFRTPYISK